MGETGTRRVILAYKNFAARNPSISHIGLGVAAMNTAKSLRAVGYKVDVFAITSASDLAARINESPQPVSHAIVSAPWIPTHELQGLITKYPDTRFAVNCHSNVGFLQADNNAVVLLRQDMHLEKSSWNFNVAGNSQKFVEWMRKTWNVPFTYLPNLYFVEPGQHVPDPPQYKGGVLRIGAFGATRVLKNFLSAVAAALNIANMIRAEDLEVWVSSGRSEGGAGVIAAAKSMLDGIPGRKLIEAGWQSWPAFRQSVRHMHLCISPSLTESFSMVTADAIVEGVPSVVSDAIDWAPDHWQAKSDDVMDIARVGRSLMSDRFSAKDGHEALKLHNTLGLIAWQEYLARFA